MHHHKSCMHSPKVVSYVVSCNELSLAHNAVLYTRCDEYDSHAGHNRGVKNLVFAGSPTQLHGFLLFKHLTPSSYTTLLKLSTSIDAGSRNADHIREASPTRVPGNRVWISKVIHVATPCPEVKPALVECDVIRVSSNQRPSERDGCRSIYEIHTGLLNILTAIHRWRCTCSCEPTVAEGIPSLIRCLRELTREYHCTFTCKSAASAVVELKRAAIAT